MEKRNNPLVTIITVTKDSEKHLKETIFSVFNQTYSNIEYIIIDGESKDSTIKIINSFKDKGFKITLISESDKGIYDAMNKGINYSNGDIIGIINSDDYYDINAVENVVRIFKTTKSDIVCGKLGIINNSNDIIDIRNSTTTRLERRMTIQHPTCFVKSEIYLKIRSFDDTFKIAADYDFFLRAKRENIEIFCTDFLIAFFRKGGKSSDFKNRLLEKKRIHEKYRTKFYANFSYYKSHFLHNIVVILRRIFPK